MYCSKCGAKVPEDGKFCGNCGEQLEVIIINKTNDQSEDKKDTKLDYYNANIKMQQESLKIQKQQLREQQKQFDNMAKCRRCGSTSLSGNKKGFGIGKAVVGASTLGPLGLMMGNLGAKKIRVTCLNCGKKFKT